MIFREHRRIEKWKAVTIKWIADDADENNPAIAFVIFRIHIDELITVRMRVKED